MKITKILVLFGFAAALVCGCTSSSDSKQIEKDKFISDLMDKMTLREKLGQLNLPSGGDMVTGAVQSADLAKMIKAGEIGGFFNVKGVEKIRELQRIAVEETELGIPLVAGADITEGPGGTRRIVAVHIGQIQIRPRVDKACNQCVIRTVHKL